jgi:hypothetical protein
MTTSPVYDLFISYAAADRPWVDGYLIEALSHTRIRLITEQTFEWGIARVPEFAHASQQSRQTLLVCSPAYLEGFAPFLSSLAQCYGSDPTAWPVVTLLLHLADAPSELLSLPALDATDPAVWQSAIDQLCAQLDTTRPAPSTNLPCPYPGLLPFRAGDAQQFYGRESESMQMVQHLREQRFLMIVGPSGAGKTSLIFAGLLPRLAQSIFFPRGFWMVRAMYPAPDTLQTLKRMVGPDGSKAERTVAALLAARPPAQRLLLIIDQFERVFAHLDVAEQHAFIAALNTLRAVEQCTLVIALRADFFGDVMRSALWPIDPAQRLELTPLRGEALRAAIENPAESVGVHFEPGVVEQIVADVERAHDALPLMQETMVWLWNAMQRRLLTLFAYSHLASAGRTGLAAAIAANGDAAIVALPYERRDTARRILLRLGMPEEGRIPVLSRQPLSALYTAEDDPHIVEETARALAQRRLLIVNDGEVAPSVELAHETIVANWPSLHDWAEERRVATLVQQQLAIRAETWLRQGSGNSGLLTEAELHGVDAWLSGPYAADIGYDDTMLALVQISRAALDVQHHAPEPEFLNGAVSSPSMSEFVPLEQVPSPLNQRTWLVFLLGVLLVLGITALGYLILSQRDVLQPSQTPEYDKAYVVARYVLYIAPDDTTAMLCGGIVNEA